MFLYISHRYQKIVYFFEHTKKWTESKLLMCYFVSSAVQKWTVLPIHFWNNHSVCAKSIIPLCGIFLGKISAQPHTTLCIQFLNRENNDKNNTLPLGKQICFTIVWGCTETLPIPIMATIISIVNFTIIIVTCCLIVN